MVRSRTMYDLGVSMRYDCGVLQQAYIPVTHVEGLRKISVSNNQDNRSPAGTRIGSS
jgi:hypothetical protein